MSFIGRPKLGNVSNVIKTFYLASILCNLPIAPLNSPINYFYNNILNDIFVTNFHKVFIHERTSNFKQKFVISSEISVQFSALQHSTVRLIINYEYEPMPFYCNVLRRGMLNVT